MIIDGKPRLFCYPKRAVSLWLFHKLSLMDYAFHDASSDTFCWNELELSLMLWVDVKSAMILLDLFWGVIIIYIIDWCMMLQKTRSLAVFCFEMHLLNFPSHLKQLLVPFKSAYSLQQTQLSIFILPRTFKEIGRQAFKFKASSDWNNLPIRLISSFHVFWTLLAYLKSIPVFCFGTS